jgi:hypothetical protein
VNLQLLQCRLTDAAADYEFVASWMLSIYERRQLISSLVEKEDNRDDVSQQRAADGIEDSRPMNDTDDEQQRGTASSTPANQLPQPAPLLRHTNSALASRSSKRRKSSVRVNRVCDFCLTFFRIRHYRINRNCL